MDRVKILTDYRQELVAEEKRLRKLLAQVEDQMHVLQIEQFHLSGLRIRTDEIEDENSVENENENKKPINLQELDLNVPDRKKICNEEEEEEEDDEMQNCNSKT